MSSGEIAAIEAIGHSPEIRPELKPLAALPGATSSFATWMTQGIEGINQTLVQADAALAQAALDGSEPPHQVMLALEEARLSFQLAMQVRNRLLEGYQELMRMQV